MDEKEIKQKLEDFKKDFQLTDEEMNEIVKAEFSEQKRARIARKLDRIRKEAKKVSEYPRARHVLLILIVSYDLSWFDMLVQGHFDKVLEEVIELREFAERNRKIIEDLKKKRKIK